jgi:quinol monooxygenase YgiN
MSVHVLAIITAKPGKRAELLAAFQANVPNVHAEDGCIEYLATVDAAGAPSSQTPFGDDTFVVVEKWATMDALKAHGAAPHMKAYQGPDRDPGHPRARARLIDPAARGGHPPARWISLESAEFPALPARYGR